MMDFDRRSAIGLALALSAGASAASPDPAEVVRLWPKGAPDAPKTPPKELIVSRSEQGPDRAINGISDPRMMVFRPSKPNGAAMLICPGGGYRRIVIDKEGYEIARLLAEHGVTSFVLFYRLPGEGWKSGPDTSLTDAQRAMRLIRANAATYGVDPARVGVMGFSAGGHLAADLAARFALPRPAVDKADQFSARPFLAAPIYPVIAMEPPLAHMGSREQLIGANASAELAKAHDPAENVPSDPPPHFLCHAEDDGSVPVGNTLKLREALVARKAVVETHLFPTGGHGFGLRQVEGTPTAIWPELFLAFAKARGLF